MDTGIMVGIAELRGKVDPKQSLEERLRVAMRGALNHWMVTDEEGQFKKFTKGGGDALEFEFATPEEAPVTGGIPTVTTQAEFNALPAGTEYQQENGERFVK